MNSGSEFARRVFGVIQDARRLDDESERGEIGERVVRRLLVERLAPGMGAAVAEHELVAVGRSLRDAQRANGAARSARILYDDLLTELFAQALRQDAPGNIARPAGGERHHERERPARPLRRRGAPREREERQQRGKGSPARAARSAVTRPHGCANHSGLNALQLPL